jgi:hypothetical protein
VRRKLIKLSHYLIRGIFVLMWIGVVYQAAFYFVKPYRAESYRLAVEYWQGLWKVLFSG